MRNFILTLLVTFLPLFAFASGSAAPKVAIIMDDMGYRSTDADAFTLPVHITFAILPHTAQSTQFAHRANAQGRTVMLHLPMETLQPRNLGPGAVFSSMTATQLTSTLESALKSVPTASGVNNHMGSKLTQLSFPMTTLMQALSERDLFFVDSRTTRFSKAAKIAEALGVPALQRRVFLDHKVEPDFIDEQFARLLRLANKYGHAVGIAHPHPLTVERLNALLGSEHSVEFVSISTLISHVEQPKTVEFANREISNQDVESDTTKTTTNSVSPPLH